MKPTCDGRYSPIGRLYFCKLTGSFHDANIVRNRNKVWVCPFRVQKIQHASLLYTGKRCSVNNDYHSNLIADSKYLRIKWFTAFISLAPSCYYNATAGFQHPCHFLDVELLVRHVLATLASPHVVKTVIWKFHCKCIHDKKLCTVAYTLCFCKSPSSVCLILRQGNSRYFSPTSKLFRQIPGITPVL
jgi:hypothetical protein